jgi:hypothetical protein
MSEDMPIPPDIFTSEPDCSWNYFLASSMSSLVVQL